MVLVKVVRLAQYVSLSIIALGFASYSETAKADETELVNRIAKALPAGWTVDVRSWLGKCSVIIKTAPDLETTASVHSQSFDGTAKTGWGFDIQVLPLYTPEMFKRIKAHNQPIKAKLKRLEYFSREANDLRRELIDVPMFHDQTYGYLVESSSWVLSRPEDVQKLMDLLKKVTADWKSYDDEKPNVMDELRRILTK
jgi:hypothetical protein